MKAYEYINKTREYLDYLEDHIRNVEKAWKILQDKCKNFKFIYDDGSFFYLDAKIKEHDLSKFSEFEFIQYRKAFYPTSHESKYDMSEAWEHHKKNNDHHWENWKNSEDADQYLCLVHNIVDWMAMGLHLGNTAQEYYENNKDKIKLPKWARNRMYEIFDCLKEVEK